MQESCNGNFSSEAGELSKLAPAANRHSPIAAGMMVAPPTAMPQPSPPCPAEPPPGPPLLRGERVALTGTLASMTHKQAAACIAQHGGEASSHVSQQTTLLVVGEEGWPLEADGSPSQKFLQAQALRERGASLRVLRESDFLHLLGLGERRDAVHRLYTPAMLGPMLDLPVSLIRRWERAGLLRAAKRVCRLPYFDFQEVARLRRLAELLDAGVPRAELEQSLAALAELFPEFPRSKLELLAHGQRVLLRDGRGLLEPASGQRVLDFEPKPASEASSSDEPAAVRFAAAFPVGQGLPTAIDWFSRGCELLEADAPAAAVEAYRMSLMHRPHDAETQFCLADALYRSGNAAAALERYYAVIESDRGYLEAWTQIGCLHSERGENGPATAALRVALELHPDYPDAHLHLAEALHAAGDSDAALPHWQQYLAFDRCGPWADLARQRLGESDDAFSDVPDEPRE